MSFLISSTSLVARICPSSFYAFIFSLNVYGGESFSSMLFGSLSTLASGCFLPCIYSTTLYTCSLIWLIVSVLSEGSMSLRFITSSVNSFAYFKTDRSARLSTRLVFVYFSTSLLIFFCFSSFSLQSQMVFFSLAFLAITLTSLLAVSFHFFKFIFLQTFRSPCEHFSISLKVLSEKTVLSR